MSFNGLHLLQTKIRGKTLEPYAKWYRYKINSYLKVLLISTVNKKYIFKKQLNTIKLL